jgi:hypothetical protein
MPENNREGVDSDRLRAAESVLKRMGYSRVPPGRREAEIAAAFWVQEAGVPRRTFPVFVDPTGPPTPEGRSDATTTGAAGPGRRAIYVVPTDRAADETWARIARTPGAAIESEVSFLVVPTGERSEPASAHFHLREVEPKEVLRLATGIVVERSLGVKSDEDALFLLYQLALRDSYAPGDPGANLHLLVLKPTGPAARLPWFAA